MTREESLLVVQVFEEFVKRIIQDRGSDDVRDYFNLNTAREELITILESMEAKPND